MFYAASKVLDLAAAPLAWAVALVILAVALVRRRPRASRVAGLLAIAVLLVFSSEPAADALMRVAERSAVRTYDDRGKYDAVVLLTGIADTGPTRSTGELQLNEAGDRLLATWDVFRTGHARQIFIAGRDDAAPVRAKLMSWGVPADRIFVDDVSRNTHENAVETAKAARQHGWRRVVVVTSAFHMARALGCFHREGLAPDALPVDYRAGSGSAAELLAREYLLERSSTALHELLGRVVYRVVGYSE